MRHRTFLEPFAHAVIDDVAPAALLADLARDWPEPEWEGWVRYDPAIERKKASDLTTPIPRRASSLLALMAGMDLGQSVLSLGTVPDLSLCGGGLHELPPRGGHVGCHQDASHHPRLGLARAWSAVLWVHQRWESDWGGELVLHDAERNPVVRIQPLPGRLAVFCTGGEAWHSVAPVLGPLPRRSLALFGYRTCAGGVVTRRRARFAPAPGEADTAEAERARRSRG
jgi:hypothetical protein